MKIPVVQQILSANDQIASENRAAFDAAGVYVVNVMASPGAGKTSLILATLAGLPRGCGWASSRATWRHASTPTGRGAWHSRWCRSTPAAGAISTRLWSAWRWRSCRC